MTPPPSFVKLVAPNIAGAHVAVLRLPMTAETDCLEVTIRAGSARPRRKEAIVVDWVG